MPKNGHFILIFSKNFLDWSGTGRAVSGRTPTLIYPKNVVNTNGKYLVELRFNGCKRAVIIDERVPVGSSGKMLTCTATFDKRKQFLPVLVEKAYMKMMGGYDFPGSNSGVDMHTLFGWIPERVDFTAGETIKVGTDVQEFFGEKLV